MVPAHGDPVISIGMPIFNAGQYLRPAVLSIIQQTFTRWELIIIDDASTDGSLDSIRELDDSRIRIIKGSDNRGLASRLNEAVGLARGKFFARMDQDDISHPERLARQLAFLESQPDVDVVGTRCVLIDVEDRVSGVLEFPENHDGVCRRPWRGILMPHPTWMGKTGWFRSNPYSSPGPYFCED
jgi:glycosyltransferase involved in cell wall biosynthesis